MFTKNDIDQITRRGISVDSVERQIEDFRRGFKPLDVDCAARLDNGIITIDSQQAAQLKELYRTAAKELNIVKFVPASGAASRMFKDLYEFLSDGKKNPTTETILNNLESIAFGAKLKSLLPDNPTEEQIIDTIVNVNGLSYGSMPKALIEFHKYEDGVRTAFEEHLVEGALYARCKENIVNIHFTVSAEHRPLFEALAAKVVPTYEQRFGVKYHISYSEQLSSTDTIAVNADNTPFRNDDGTLTFRPAGHGALVANLNAIDADVIFVKNIDNVTTDRLKEDTVNYKQVLAGMLLQTQKLCFDYLNRLDNAPCDELLEEIIAFLDNRLMYRLSEQIKEKESSELIPILHSILNRPIRICGMVRNEGEPGGGPFWVRQSDGSLSLQIAEPSQIAPQERHLLAEGTHFNPVDLVCGTINYKGESFDLQNYVDVNTGFISNKSKNGRELKALELPGLWNGSMAFWNTLFIEVPASTFTPVKTVADLLRDQHR